MRSGSCICDQATKRRAFAADLLQMQQRATIDIIYGCDRWPPPYGLINMAIMCVAAVTFGETGSAGDATIENAYRMLGPMFGGISAAIFMISLLASGLSSSVVGIMAGQVIMQNFVDWHIPLLVRRLVTMLPFGPRCGLPRIAYRVQAGSRAGRPGGGRRAWVACSNA